MTNVQEFIQGMIEQGRKMGHIDTNQISDGYHTFGELYEHRIELYLALISVICSHNMAEGGYVELDVKPWRAKLHSDGSSFEGWFVLGLSWKDGKQITYHLPMSYWERLDGTPDYLLSTYDKAPEWDGHTSSDVLQRLKAL